MKKKLSIICIILSIVLLLSACASIDNMGDGQESIDGISFQHLVTYTQDDTYQIYRPNNYQEALVYSVKEAGITSFSKSWIVNYEGISYYYSSKDYTESDELINAFYEYLLENVDSINSQLSFSCSIEENNMPYILEKELTNPYGEEISYYIFATFIPFLVKNISSGYTHHVYIPVYRSIIMVNGNSVEDPFENIMITMEAFEAKYKK